jgi:hypothetical protein
MNGDVPKRKRDTASDPDATEMTFWRFTMIEFWYSIPTVFKIGQFQSEYSPGIITVGIQSETFIPVVIQSHLCPCIGIGHENLTVFVSLEFW